MIDLTTTRDRSDLVVFATLVMVALLAAASLVAPPSVAASGTAQPSFSGEVQPVLTVNIPPEDGYDASPVNPGNFLGISDITFGIDNTLKLSAVGDTTAADLWLRFNYLPVTEMLTGVAGTPEYVAELVRAVAYWRPTRTVELAAGRQSLSSGYGYGWNPVDLISPTKDPSDPGAELRGVDAVSFSWSPVYALSMRAYGALAGYGGSADYDQVLAGGDVTLRIAGAELMLAGLYGGDDPAVGPDPYPNALGAAAFVDLFGVGLYAEGSWRPESRRGTPDGAGQIVADENDTWTALVGLEYFLPAGPVLNAEYFYNGEGYDDDERSAYIGGFAFVPPASAPAYLGALSPGYFARHYILANMSIPMYTANTTINLATIVSPDSSVVAVSPSVEVNLDFEGSLTAGLSWNGIFSWDEDDVSEATLSPVNHTVAVDLAYHF